MTQGIYRFDPAIYDAVRDTPLDREIPHEILYRLPEWCVYVETPGLAIGEANGALAGVFAHLEHDVNSNQRELRLLLDVDQDGSMALLPLPLHLGAWSLAESIDRMLDQASAASLARGGPSVPRALVGVLRPALAPVVSLLLYLCSQAAEIGGANGRSPGNPQPKRTRRDGWRLFPAEAPRTWEVGVRLGAALRRAYQTEQTQAQGAGTERAGPRPHVRRAHWHTILSGPRLRDGAPIPSAERRAELRWMPPIAVNLEDVADLPATVRTVR